MERERVVEILLGLIFVVLVFMMIVVGLALGDKNDQATQTSSTTSQVITNSYNEINIEEESERPIQRIYYRDRDYDAPRHRIYYKDRDYDHYWTDDRDFWDDFKDYYDGGFWDDSDYRDRDWWDWENRDHYWGENDYDSYGRHTKEKTLGYYADTYKVYVKNHGKADYFTVRFYFEDYWGDEKKYDVRKYIYSGEKELFYFRDTSKDKHEYYRWRYRVFN